MPYRKCVNILLSVWVAEKETDLINTEGHIHSKLGSFESTAALKPLVALKH